MGSESGVSAMIAAAVAFENDLGLLTLSIGRSAADPAEDCVLEACGTWICFRLALYVGEVHVAATEMDSGAPFDLLMRAKDTEDGWDVVRRLVGSMERNEVRSLTRPIAVGRVGDVDSWVIG